MESLLLLIYTVQQYSSILIHLFLVSAVSCMLFGNNTNNVMLLVCTEYCYTTVNKNKFYRTFLLICYCLHFAQNIMHLTSPWLSYHSMSNFCYCPFSSLMQSLTNSSPVPPYHITSTTEACSACITPEKKAVYPLLHTQLIIVYDWLVSL